VTRRIKARLPSLLLALGLALASAGDARAGSNDKDVESLIDNALQTNYLNSDFKGAIEQLDFGKQACGGSSCSPKVRAKLFIAYGTIYAGGMSKPKEAKEAFAAALKEDPTAKLFSDFINPDVQKAFNEARSGGSASGGTPETQKLGPTARKPKKVWPGNGRPVRGWRSPEAAFYFDEATKSEAGRDWLDCADYAQASLAAENRVSTRFLAASCEERAGLWIEALGDYQIVGDTAARTGLITTGNQARQRAQALKDKIPKIVIHKPAKADGLVVKMNDVEIPGEKLDGEIWINPGQRTIRAKGRVNGADLEFEQIIEAAEGKTATVDIKLGLQSDREAMRCMLSAQSRDDFAKCLRSGSGLSFNLHLGTEISAYHDSDHVDVVTPAFMVAAESPTGGWGVNASFLVDVVTAASTDIVATASPRWRETRYVPAVGGHKKFGDVDVSLKGNLSREPDYLALSAGGGVSVDLRQKTITPSLGYEFSHDVSGRAGTPFSVFSHQINRHSLAAGATFVLDKATFFAAGLTAVLESGDTSKPYRSIPLFAPDVAARVPVGLSIEGVAQNRLPIRPYEQLPTERQRWAVAGLIAHRFRASTIRAEERLYIDSWGLKASTTAAQYFIDLDERLRIWPQFRFNAQTGTSFWRLAYEGAPVFDKSKQLVGVAVPALRTGDRELGPLFGLTLGAGARYAFGEKKTWAVSLLGDVIYTRFLDHLYLFDRLGFLGATTLEVDFE
jgi:hypothetical protein